MAGIKSLAKDTAIYGLSSIVGRFLNYLLVPLYTAVLPAASGGYGVVSNVYAYTALILVLLTFGMETGFSVLPISRTRMRRRYMQFPAVCGRTLAAVCGAVHGLFASALSLVGVSGPSRLYCHDGVCGGPRFLPVYTFRLPAL